MITEETEESTIRYIRRYELMVFKAECGRTYYHYAVDEMGSITYITTEDEVLNHYEYDAWAI